MEFRWQIYGVVYCFCAFDFQCFSNEQGLNFIIEYKSLFTADIVCFTEIKINKLLNAMLTAMLFMPVKWIDRSQLWIFYFQNIGFRSIFVKSLPPDTAALTTKVVETPVTGHFFLSVTSFLSLNVLNSCITPFGH